jgi:plasmid stabilization system protein ParE
VPRLIYRKQARRDIAEIANYIARASTDRAAGKAFIDKITRFCEHLAGLPGLLGRPRPEYGRDYRSTTFGNYIIFLRYAGKGSKRSNLHIMHVLHGSRDMDAYFSRDSGDGGMFEVNEEEQASYGALRP